MESTGTVLTLNDSLQKVGHSSGSGLWNRRRGDRVPETLKWKTSPGKSCTKSPCSKIS